MRIYILAYSNVIVTWYNSSQQLFNPKQPGGIDIMSIIKTLALILIE